MCRWLVPLSDSVSVDVGSALDSTEIVNEESPVIASSLLDCSG